MTPPLYPRPLLYCTLCAAALLAGAGGCSTSQAGKSQHPAPLQPGIAKLKPKAKVGNTPATASLPKDGAEDSVEESGQGEDSVSRAAASLQKILGKGDPRTDAPDVPAAMKLPPNPRARTKPQTPTPPREAKVYPAPPPPVLQEVDPIELQPVPPAPSALDGQGGSTPDAVLFSPAVPAPAVAVAPPTPIPVTVSPKAAPAPAAAAWPTTFAMPAASLCSRVESFGRFTPLAPSAIQPGRTTPVLLYTEFEGFQHRTQAGLPAPMTTEPDGRESDTDWVVEIEQEITLYDATGLQCMHIPAQAARDIAKRRRRDHFLVQRLTLPSRPPGQYSLKITARDRATGYAIETNLPITIGSSRQP